MKILLTCITLITTGFAQTNIDELIKQLDANTLKEREAATIVLEQIVKKSSPEDFKKLCKTYSDQKSPEVRSRVFKTFFNHYQSVHGSGYIGLAYYEVAGFMYVSMVVTGSPADNTDIEEDDVIIAINDVVPRSREHFSSMIKGFKPFTKIIIHLQRRGADILVPITVGYRPNIDLFKNERIDEIQNFKDWVKKL